MALRIIEKDLLTVEEGIICHQVNCMGVMGAGVALQIRNKFPLAYQEYLESIHDYKSVGDICLGSCNLVQVTPELLVANLFGQYSLGVGKQTSYAALCSAMSHLVVYLGGSKKAEKANVYFPYLIGCGLGGAKWEVVSELIEEQFPNAIICKLP